MTAPDYRRLALETQERLQGAVDYMEETLILEDVFCRIFEDGVKAREPGGPTGGHDA